MGPSQPGAVHAVRPASRPPVSIGGRLSGLPAARRSGVRPPTHSSRQGRHKPATTVGCARAASVFQGMRGGARVQRVSNCSSAAGRPNPGSG